MNCPQEHAWTGLPAMLRPIVALDYDAILPMFSDEQQMKYFGPGKTYSSDFMRQKVQEWAQENQAVAPKKLFLCIVDGNKCAGLIILTFSELTDGPTEIGRMIAPSMQRQGLAEGAANAAMQHFGGGFFATVHPENKASIRGLEKIGFACDPLRQNIDKYGSKRNYYTKTIHKPKL